MSEIRKTIEGIVAMPGFTDEQKRAKIEKLTLERNSIAEKITVSLRQQGRQNTQRQ